MIQKLGLKRPPAGNTTVRSTDEAVTAAAKRIGYPLVVRPSYVLGGRAMEIVLSTRKTCPRIYARTRCRPPTMRPVLLDSFLNADASEVDIDAVSDGDRKW